MVFISHNFSRQVTGASKYSYSLWDLYLSACSSRFSPTDLSAWNELTLTWRMFPHVALRTALIIVRHTGSLKSEDESRQLSGTLCRGKMEFRGPVPLPEQKIHILPVNCWALHPSRFCCSVSELQRFLPFLKYHPTRSHFTRGAQSATTGII